MAKLSLGKRYLIYLMVCGALVLAQYCVDGLIFGAVRRAYRPGHFATKAASAAWANAYADAERHASSVVFAISMLTLALIMLAAYFLIGRPNRKNRTFRPASPTAA